MRSSARQVSILPSRSRSLVGYFGFGRNPGGNFTDQPFNGAGSSQTGAVQCFTTTGVRLGTVAGNPGVALAAPVVPGSPCTNLGVWNGSGVDPVRVKDEGVTWRFNLSWKPSSDLMLYATASRGFRPGGVNRRVNIAPYDPDFLTNFEIGWKSTLAPGLRLNGSIYQQNWKRFQFSFLGANSFTEIHNGPDARIRGVEVDLAYRSGGLNMTLAAAYTDAKMTKNLCLADDPTFVCAGGIASPAGTRLPITPQFKISGTARYTIDKGNVKYFGQLNASHQGSASSDVRATEAAVVGRLPAFSLVNLSLGAEWESFSVEAFVSNVFDERGQLSRFLQCGQCGQRPYVVTTQPRTIGLRAGVDF
jgi:iron complex outermembrane receptor protein